MVITYDRNPKLSTAEVLDSLTMNIQLALNEKADNDTVAKTYIAKSELLNLLYPIGIVVESMDTEFDPNITWGGVWEQATAGKWHRTA